jgi:DHA2 family multidrug resistance protein
MSLFFVHDPPYVKGMKMKVDYWGLALLSVGIGCLQIMLDKGQREDWFSSNFITWLCIISAVSLLIFVIIELFAEEPIVNLRALKSLSFSLGNIVLFFVFFSMFGSIILLPIYLQTLMGYTATLAGIILAPGGIASLVVMPVVGRLIAWVNSKVIIVCGLIVTAWSIYLMSLFNRMADFEAILWPRVLLGAGMGLIVIPLTTLTLSSIRKEEMGNATSIFNFVRMIGGSFGIAITTTILTRRAQFHQSRIVEHLTPFDTSYSIGVRQSADALITRGFDPVLSGQGGLGVIYDQVLRESSMMSFNDVFLVLTVLLVMIIPLVLFMRQIYHNEPSDQQR